MAWVFPSPDGHSREPFRVSYDWLETRYGLALSGAMDDADTIRNYLHRCTNGRYVRIDPKDMSAVREIMLKAEEVLSRRQPSEPAEKLVASNLAKRAKKWLEDV
jgi:hypothetical protein